MEWEREGGATWSSPDNAPASFFQLAIWVRFAVSFFGILSMVMLLTLVTRSCASNTLAGVQYASFLSILDFGDTVSGLATTPIASALGVRYGDFEPLSGMLYIGAACKAAVCLFIPLLAVHDDDNDKMEEVEPA